MNRPLLKRIVTASCHLLGFALLSEAIAEPTAEEISSTQVAAYISAFEKGDAAAVAALYTEDAQYSVNEGQNLSGRAAIAEQTESFFASAPGAQLDIAVESSRFLTPDVLIEKGLATVTDAEGEFENTSYTATLVKTEGEWLIADMQETILPSESLAAEALGSLEWLIGKWKVATEGIDAETEAIWTLGGNFITRTSRIGKDEGDDFVSVEVIGFDPVDEKLVSWVFDNEGGFGSNHWRSDGNKWLVHSKATGPDGRLSSSQHVLTLLDDDRFGLESINRILDGEALPNRDEIEITRVPASN